jgi:hypothetical protein
MFAPEDDVFAGRPGGKDPKKKEFPSPKRRKPGPAHHLYSRNFIKS